jgi:hypothetical protein
VLRLAHAADDGRFDDPKLTAGQLVKSSRRSSRARPERWEVELFPTDFRARGAGLLESAAKRGDPMRRLSLELSLMKCIHALYAMAIGFRSSSEFESEQRENDAWLALSVGESILKSGRR